MTAFILRTTFILLITTFVYAADENHELEVSAFLQKTNEEDPIQTIRKIQNLNARLIKDSRVQSELLRYFFDSKYWYLENYIVSQLTQVPDLPVPLIQKAWKTYKGNFDDFLLLCGTMNLKSEEINPMLLKALNDPAKRNYEGAIRVALFLNGLTSPENTSKIIAYTKPNKKLTQSVENDAIRLISLTGKTSHFPKEIHQNLVDNLTSHSDIKVSSIGASAALALGALKDKGKFALPALKKHFQAMQKDTNLSVIQLIYGFAIYSIDPSNNLNILRINMLSMGEGNDSHHAGMLSGFLLLDENMILGLATLLEDKDPVVVKGTLMMLQTIGLPAQKVTPQILKIVEFGKDDNLKRDAAAYALGLVAPKSVIPKLRQLIKVEKDENVRESLKQSLKIIEESN